MNSEYLNEALSIKSEQDRADYLDKACGSDVELRSQIEELLALHAEAGSFLERPAVRGIEQTIDLSRDAMEAGRE